MTPAQYEVLKAKAQGLSSKQTARILRCSHKTVEVHTNRILRLVGARNMTHAVAIAYQLGILK
jgi:DNA-binding CsgD family transcriptional regulator